LLIELSHYREQVGRENHNEDPTAVHIENGIYQITNNEQDKQERRNVKTKDQMIGIIVFYSDIRQPNEEREDGKKEKYGKRKFGNKIS